ncbi:MAG: nucleoside hydrolase [Patescibacteria group bacterium]
MTSTNSKKIILDVDTGIDDALAIIFLYPYLAKNIIGITTCGGNVSVDQTTRNTLAVLSLLKSNIPVYKGATKPLAKKSFVYAKYYHGKNGLADIKLKNKLAIQKDSATDFIIKATKKYPGLTIVTTAPPTNIARAIKKDKTVAKRIKKIYLMGGAINVKGNESDFAETNFFQDPEAVKLILQNFSDINIISLDVTNKTLITKSDLKKIKNNSPAGLFSRQSITNWFELFGDKKNRQFELYDPLAVSAVFKNFLSFTKIKIDIDTKNNIGQLVKGPYTIKYANKVKTAEFKNFLIKTINRYS